MNTGRINVLTRTSLCRNSKTSVAFEFFLVVATTGDEVKEMTFVNQHKSCIYMRQSVT